MSEKEQRRGDTVGITIGGIQVEVIGIGVDDDAATEALVEQAEAEGFTVIAETRIIDITEEDDQ